MSSHPFAAEWCRVFHDLLVDLRLLLVAEVEEGEEGRQTRGRLGSRERRRSSQRDNHSRLWHGDGCDKAQRT